MCPGAPPWSWEGSHSLGVLKLRTQQHPVLGIGSCTNLAEGPGPCCPAQGEGQTPVWTGYTCASAPTPGPLPTASRHPGAHGDIQLGVCGAPGPLRQQPRGLQPQQVLGWGAGRSSQRAPRPGQGLTPCSPQCRLPALPLPEAASAHRPQGLPGAAAAAWPPSDPLAGSHARCPPSRAPSAAPHRHGPPC